MKISTKGRYALRLMLDIAAHDSGEPVRIKEIASRQEISAKYLEQIVAILSKAGYVKSIRGPQGGYRLTRKPEEYSLGDILRLTEGSLAPVECLEGETNQCPRAGDCITLLFWKKLDKAIREVTEGYTLEDLLTWQNQAGNNYII
ncbi:MAG TPA: Rrf2 family transcriptional regulator [Candidatus Blautia ornithocaccae]|uniref:RrF2 family transcriptional regulator n=1 Tax=Blautia sp. An81 TaxID=1965659 RepID=UPI000B36E250|nr:Rrf2 family transcriptional regulator [Blautia sp. An81]OUN24947.1 Rrf2 family transcriptional regulator [Blautia sp. An81]HJD36179.1 Rrf2 family transcriptional regulator [Candidatus Blautia ornithocaccae]